MQTFDLHPLMSELAAQGWRPRDLPGFIGAAGPLWTRREAQGWAYGLAIGAQHLNPAGVAHGGALVTLIDHTLSTVAWEANQRQPCLSLQLDTQFLAAVHPGQFALAQAHILRQTASLLFMQGQITVNGQPVLTAQALLKRMGTPAVRRDPDI